LARWYDSLSGKSPDYAVYGEPSYIADIWTCWAVYSRQSVKAIFQKDGLVDRSLASELDPKGLIVDAGCGIAHTTIALKQAFPSARVVGTNIEATWQYELARGYAKDYGFETLGSLESLSGVELFFASEYFEHFQRPLEHLREVVRTCRPKWFVIANGFNGRSIGHFDEYLDGIKKIDSATMAKLFWTELRSLGYRKLKTKIWNSRPSVWIREQE